MTLECCNRMAKTLRNSQSMLKEAVEDFKSAYGDKNGSELIYYGPGKNDVVSSPLQIFYPIGNLLHFQNTAAYWGFDGRYGVPKSKKAAIDPDSPSPYQRMEIYHGLYPTRMDMNFLFGTGQEHGKWKLNGWKEKCYIDPESSKTGRLYAPDITPPYGAIMRNHEGQKVMRCEYAREQDVTSGKKERDVLKDGSVNSYWKRYKGKKTLSGGMDSLYPYNTYFRLSQPIAEGRNDYSGLVWSGVGDGRMYLFYNYLWVNETQETRDGLIAEELINTTLKLTKHADLLTNDAVKENYITINNEFGPPVIPLKKGVQYYIFAECANGGFTLSNPKATNYFQTLGGMAVERRVNWPRWDN